MLQRRFDADDGGVGLGPHQAGEPVAGGAADAGRLLGTGLVDEDAVGQREGVQPRPGQVGLELFDAGFVGDGRPGIGGFGRRFGGIEAPLAVDGVELLGSGVPGVPVGGGQGPGRRDAVDVADLAEVALPEAEQDGAIDLGVAAHVVVLLGRELLAGRRVGPLA